MAPRAGITHSGAALTPLALRLTPIHAKARIPIGARAVLAWPPQIIPGASEAVMAVVETRYGAVQGAVVDGVHIFRGIPYGGPTEGPGRFLPPAPPAPWPGLRDATITGPRCVQTPDNLFLHPLIGEYFGGGRPDRVSLTQQSDSENCLVLNVLTPGLAGKRPVLVYIHGGGFMGGSSIITLLSDRMAREQDVVLVGVNHRLNVFGYLYLGAISERYTVGNVGQLDLVAALAWVRDNIAAFGGDPGNVTLCGESGGGGKISALMGMPAAAGLFHRAIVESGSMTHVSEAAQGAATAKALLANLDLGEGQLDALQQIPADALFGAAVARPAEGAEVEGLMRFAPVVDGHTIPEQPWEPQAPALSAGIPMIIGCCKDEGSLFSMGQPELYSLDWDGLSAQLARTGMDEGDVRGLLALYHRDHPHESPSDLYFRIRTDRTLRQSAIRQAELQAARGQAAVYMYYFSWNTPCGEGRVRAFHTAELPLAMRLVCYAESEQLSRQISGAWAAFARGGDPNHEGLPPWPAYATPQRATMIFDAPQSQVVDDPSGEALHFLSRYPLPAFL